MPHCLNCGKPIDAHVEVAYGEGPEHIEGHVVLVCPTSTYVEADDVIGDPPDADR